MAWLALQHDQLETAYLAVRHLIKNNCHMFSFPAVFEQCIAAARKGNATLCQIVFDTALYHGSKCGRSAVGYATLMYQILRAAHAARQYDLCQQVVQNLRPGSMRLW
jgi:hypothetical protein